MTTNTLHTSTFMDDFALLATVLQSLLSLVTESCYPSWDIESENSVTHSFHTSMYSLHMYKFHYLFWTFGSEQTRSCTPCGHYAHLALTQMKINTWNLSTPHNDSYIQQRKCSHGFKNRNNRELKNNRNSTIHSGIHIPIYTFGTMFLYYIHPTETFYIHTFFFTIP
jgi:hypothetical protein